MTNPHKGRTGLDRILHAAGYSWAGLRAAYLGESAFRQETWLTIFGVPLAFWVGRDWVQVALRAQCLLHVVGEKRNVRCQAHAHRHARFLAGIHHRQCIGVFERKRLFAKHRLAGGSDLLDQLAVRGVRRGQPYHLHLRVGQSGFQRGR